jgi:hypothetical protein
MILYKYKWVCLLHPSNYNSLILQKNQAKGERKSYKHNTCTILSKRTSKVTFFLTCCSRQIHEEKMPSTKADNGTW